MGQFLQTVPPIAGRSIKTVPLSEKIIIMRDKIEIDQIILYSCMVLKFNGSLMIKLYIKENGLYFEPKRGIVGLY